MIGRCSFLANGCRRPQQFIQTLVPHELPAEDGLIGGVFQQAADEIRHAGDEFAQRRIDAKPVARLHDRILQGFRHPMQHLNLDGQLVQALAFGFRHRQRDMAQVMRAEGGAEHIGVFQQERRQALIACIGFVLVCIDRNRPATLQVHDGFIVPVRALDQPDAERAAARPRPREQIPGILLRIFEVGLQGDLRVRVAAEFIFHEQPSEYGQREVLPCILLHVECDRDAQPCGAPEDRSKPPRDRFITPVRVHGIELRGQSGELDGHLAARDRPQMVSLEQRIGRPGCGRLGKRGHGLHIALRVGFSFALRDHGLAEKVHRVGDAVLPQFRHGREHVLQVGARDELVAHLKGLGGDRVCREPCAQSDRGEGLHTPPHERAASRGFLRHTAFAEILRDQAFGLRGGFQCRQNVNETEELDLERVVLDGPFHEPAAPPGAVEQAGRGGGSFSIKRFGVFGDIGFGGELPDHAILYSSFTASRRS